MIAYAGLDREQGLCVAVFDILIWDHEEFYWEVFILTISSLYTLQVEKLLLRALGPIWVKHMCTEVIFWV